MRLFLLPHTIIGFGIILAIPARLIVHSYGTVVTGHVDDKSTSSGRKGGTTYYAKFHYTIGGKRLTDNRSIDRQVYNTIHPGDTFNGRAMQIAGHGLFIPADWKPLKESLMFVGFALFWNGILSIFLYIAWVAPLRERWLLMTGQAVAGTITTQRIFSGKSTSHYLSYQFTTLDGQVKTREQWVTAAAYRTAHVDQPVTVIYNPNRPKRSIAFEVSSYRLRQ